MRQRCRGGGGGGGGGGGVQVGLIPRILQQLFVALGATHGEANNPGLRCSYIEVYNEMVKDLLSPVGTVDGRRQTHPS